jgi:hypothetical protein
MSTKAARKTADVPTVGAVARDTIIELVYDPEQKQTGLVVSRFDGMWNIEQSVAIHTGETLVPYSADNNLIAHGCVLLPSKPEHHGDKASVLADVEAFLHRYVELSPLFAKIASHYVLLSWVHEAFNELPYLRLRGDYGTGKTRGLLAIGSICYRPIFASGASTISPIFHTLDRFGGTLILDEADFRTSDAAAEVVKILNNGHMKGMPVLRTIVTKEREFNPTAFRVFGPKLIAMRGGFDDPALDSRFVTEDTNLRSMRADIPISLPAAFYEEGLALRNRLLHFRLCNFFSAGLKPNVFLPDVEPRVNQIAAPLLSMVDDPSVRAEIGEWLARDYRERVEQRRSSVEARLLTILRQASLRPAGLPISIGLLTEHFNAAHGADEGRSLQPKTVGHIVRKEFRLTTVRSNSVYVVPVSEVPKIRALHARYTGIGLDNEPAL